MNMLENTATDGQHTPPETATEEGQPPAKLREPSANDYQHEHSTCPTPARNENNYNNTHPERGRIRRQRVPLNAGVMGDIEKIYYFAEQNHDFEVGLSDPELTGSKDVLLYEDIFKTNNVNDWLKAGQAEANSIILEPIILY